MSRAVSMVLLHALIDDFSTVPRSGASGGIGRGKGSARAAPVVSPAVGRRVVDAASCADGPGAAVLADWSTAVLIHGAATRALAVWGPAAAVRPETGIDVAEEPERHCVESVHRSLALLTELPRTVPVTVGLAMGPGWRDALDLILARGRSVRF